MSEQAPLDVLAWRVFRHADGREIALGHPRLDGFARVRPDGVIETIAPAGGTSAVLDAHAAEVARLEAEQWLELPPPRVLERGSRRLIAHYPTGPVMRWGEGDAGGPIAWSEQRFDEVAAHLDAWNALVQRAFAAGYEDWLPPWGREGYEPLGRDAHEERTTPDEEGVWRRFFTAPEVGAIGPERHLGIDRASVMFQYRDRVQGPEVVYSLEGRPRVVGVNLAREGGTCGWLYELDGVSGALTQVTSLSHRPFRAAVKRSEGEWLLFETVVEGDVPPDSLLATWILGARLPRSRSYYRTEADTLVVALTPEARVFHLRRREQASVHYEAHFDLDAPARVLSYTDEDHDAWAVVHQGRKRARLHAALPVSPLVMWDETAANGTTVYQHETLHSTEAAVARFFALVASWLGDGATLTPPPLRFQRPDAARAEFIALHVPVDPRFEWSTSDARGVREHHAEDKREWGAAIVAFNRKASALLGDGYALQPGRFAFTMEALTGGPLVALGTTPFDRRASPDDRGGVAQSRHAGDREAPSRRVFDADGALRECATIWRAKSHGITAHLQDARIVGVRRFEGDQLRALRLLQGEVVVAQSDDGHDAQGRRDGLWILREVDSELMIRETHQDGRLTRGDFAPLAGGKLPPLERISAGSNPASCTLAFASDERLVMIPLPRGLIARRATLEPGAPALDLVAQRQSDHDMALMIFVRTLLWGVHEQAEGRLRLLTPERVFTRSTEFFTLFAPATAILAWRTGTLGEPDTPHARRLSSVDEALREADALVENYTREGFTERVDDTPRPRGTAQPLANVVRATGPDGARVELAFQNGVLARMRSFAPNGRPVLHGWHLEPDDAGAPARFTAEALTRKPTRTYCVFALRTPFSGPFPEFVAGAPTPSRGTRPFPGDAAPRPASTREALLACVSGAASRAAFVAMCRRLEDLARADRERAEATIPALVTALDGWPSRLRAAPFDWVDLFLDGTLPDGALALVRALCVSPAIVEGRIPRLLAWWAALSSSLPALEGLSLGRDDEHRDAFFRALDQRPGAAERVRRMQRGASLEETVRALLAAPIARGVRVLVAPLPEIPRDIFSTSDQDSFLDRDLGLDALAEAPTLEAVDLFGHSGAMRATQRAFPRLTALRVGGGQWPVSGDLVRRLGADFPRLRRIDLRGSHADVAPTLTELDDETSARLTRYWWLPGTLSELRSLRITPDDLASLVASCADLAWLRLPPPAVRDPALGAALAGLSTRGIDTRDEGLGEPFWTNYFDP